MEFNKHINGGHRGARKFWREMLPRIKYRNPAVSITINRHSDPAGPANLYIYTSSPKSKSTTTASSTSTSTSTSASSSPSVPDTAEPTHTVDIRMVHESEILAQLVSRTNAEELQPTEEEVRELAEMAEFKARSEADRVIVRERFLKERKEQELLRLARGEVGGTQ
ncbi:uncharacterized protein EI97DRAFT_425605 [Westerdykella ornata]|uniref:Ribosomal protein/NADH dehydrogenase domain-containing protein n=1 Tax=Westerdykella ornata TaxID=318751 RepID=A0A6A6J938_WESOR|nr:uncharacterized protein EI97DRAFT_425605 [Westerdykella ornata]KAF2272855.1 hypothetical protein EI97DRAFT_425605 [Westerdykella ornata]